MEQLHDEAVRAGLHQWRDRRVAEGGIGFVDHASKDVIRNFAVDERRQNGEGDFLIALAAQSADLFFGEGRPITGYVEAAITCKAGQKGVAEAKSRGFSPR